MHRVCTTLNKIFLHRLRTTSCKVYVEVPSTAYRSPTNRARMNPMDAAQHTAAALRRLRTTGRSEPPAGRRGRASPKIESAGGGRAKQRSAGSLPVTPHTAASRDFTRSARSGDKAPRPRDSFKRVDLHDPALAQFVDASSTLRMHTPRESYMRTLQKSHWASDGALNSHGRSLIMTDQDVTVPGASKPRPKHRKSDQWRDQGTPPQACNKAVKPQADRPSSPVQTRSVCTAVRRVSVSPQVMNKDQEIHALTPSTPAVRDQVLPALLDAGLILLMTVAALGLLAGYVLMCNSFHKR